jgi:hypothetical protein
MYTAGDLFLAFICAVFILALGIVFIISALKSIWKFYFKGE